MKYVNGAFDPVDLPTPAIREHLDYLLRHAEEYDRKLMITIINDCSGRLSDRDKFDICYGLADEDYADSRPIIRLLIEKLCEAMESKP